MRVNVIWAFVIAVSVAAASAEDAGKDFPGRLEFVKGADLSGIFEGVAVKVDRPMSWRTFVRGRYRLLKGRGRVGEGDLGDDPDAAVWLAILDPEYRRDGRLIFVEGGDVPGVADDRWLSLREFEGDVMPGIVRNPESFGGGDAERAITDIVGRATALHWLSWSGLLVIPGSDVAGWRPVNAESLVWRRVRDLNEAYERRDAAAMREAAGTLAVALKRQPGYPPREKLSLEKYLDKYAVLKIGFGLYAASALLFFVWAALGRRRVADAGAWAALAGFALVTVVLAGRSVVAGHLPVAGTYELLLLFSWSVVLFFLVFYSKTRGAFLGLVLMPAAVIVVVAASFFPSDVETQLAPALRSGWFTARGIMVSLGEGAFAVGFAAAALRLFRSGAASKRFPSGDALDGIEYRAMALGYPLFAVGALVAGAIWAQQARAAWWNWERSDVASLVVFALATAYLHARGARGWRGNGAAALAVLTFIAAVWALFAGAVFAGRPSHGL
ncbi:MAG TPA: cytochrome c biogenesis protein CcsA [bacterium]|nr:cytochrome c biogenesis protein CcsA [bacterium]